MPGRSFAPVHTGIPNEIGKPSTDIAKKSKKLSEAVLARHIARLASAARRYRAFTVTQ
jgi:hypothetical protein